MYWLRVGGSAIEAYVDECDPAKCMPNGNRTKMPLIIDCLAQGQWEEYKPRFGTRGLPQKCPPVFLQCNGTGSPGPDQIFHMRSHFGRGTGDGFDEDSGEYFDEDSDEGAQEDAEFPGDDEGRRRFGRWLRGVVVGADVPSRAQGQSARHEAFAAAQQRHESLVGGTQGKHRRAGNGGFQKQEMPTDPITMCKPSLLVEYFHVARQEAPFVLSTLGTLNIIRTVLMVPCVLLWALGLFWGFSLWSRMQTPYSQRVMQHGYPQLMFQSFAAPGQEMQMVQQPLILDGDPSGAISSESGPPSE